MQIEKYFTPQELVCRDVYARFGQQSLQFFAPEILENLYAIREGLGRPITVNNWAQGGQYSQRGLRCNLCQLVKSKTSVYLSAHLLGRAVDFTVQGMTAEEVRQWIAAHATLLPHPIRLERNVTWVHMDVLAYGMTEGAKISYF